MNHGIETRRSIGSFDELFIYYPTSWWNDVTLSRGESETDSETKQSDVDDDDDDHVDDDDDDDDDMG